MYDEIWPYCEGSRREEPERGRGAEEIVDPRAREGAGGRGDS